MSLKRETAEALLSIGAVRFSPDQPFTWASGIQSPIYCDNRLTMSYPEVRKRIAKGLAELILAEYPEAEVIAGTATAGIPHAAWVSDLMDKPMIYIRSKPKGHGRGNQIEGELKEGSRTVIIEDLISTGGSSLTAAAAAKEAGADVLGVVSIFTYGLEKAVKNFKEAGLSHHSLTDFDALANAAADSGAIPADSLPGLHDWHGKLKIGGL
ncbi:orotate phosphoribosyltransferase [Bhargavaea beijingensis]|uniref:Orotate phosphoribosyltransferase n=1 Tax=Bhargavaea beijingensis TaxID=426756 RepID=A0A1G7C805_9BACL|nr:orotate phosphoribosyltransferase [Bhargavaea beijingensis]MCW1926881.1 orotate phosphoribosyltransferase [Bhargavaea beijingensis]RSK36874.1 orotate phosphoribosyltransferase [Bhargavaea beijingensis]SDE35449.1 orotate phosphoribosyltransferase [Bhargavaea beijingensis]